jgi:hypothetical protein
MRIVERWMCRYSSRAMLCGRNNDNREDNRTALHLEHQAFFFFLPRDRKAVDTDRSSKSISVALDISRIWNFIRR